MLGRLTKVTNKKGTNTISEYTYGYDNNGNITSIADSAGTTTYQYDKLNRLTNILRPDGKTIAYTYDLKGNRKTLQDDTAALDLTAATYAYDSRDRLTSVTKGGVTTNIKYRGDGLRYQKTIGTSTVQYHYNDNGEVVAEADGTGAVKANYIWGPDRMLVKKDAASGNQYYYMYNGHGDVVQIVDSTGAVVKSYSYDAFGNEVNPDANDTNPFRYCGEYFDKETGLVYLRARYYDPQLGRFINEDSYEGQVTDPLSLNLYTYCHNDPINYLDPTGHIRQGYTDKNGVYHADPDAEEFGKNSDTYKICLDAGNKWKAATAGSQIRKDMEKIAQTARTLARAGTPLLYAQDKVMKELHNNVSEAKEANEYLNSNGLYIWFVNMTCNDWDYKLDDNWRVPYSKFSGVNMNEKKKDGSYPKNWTPWMYFDGMIMSADKFANLNLGYVGKKMGYDGYLLKNPTTTGAGDEFWIQYGINMATQGR